MPRTVPTIDGSGQRKEVTVKYIDSDGKRRSDTWKIDQAATDPQIEAAIAAAAALTNASIYKVYVSQVYSGAMSAANALDEVNDSVMDNLVILYKNSVTDEGRDFFVPAPVETVMVPNTEIVDNTAPLYTAFRDAIDVMLNNFSAVTVRFTERRKKNASTSATGTTP